MKHSHKKFLKAFEGISLGSIHIKTPDGRSYDFKGHKPGPQADLTIKEWAVIDMLLERGETGFGEDYINGFWDTDSVPELLTFATLNAPSLEKHLFHGRLWEKIYFYFDHLRNRNSLKGSRRNIEYHYDLGNDFYKLWLDSSMTYSSAFYNGKNVSLEQAQDQKYQRLLGKMSRPSSLLEIGCGWGGFAQKAGEAGHQLKGLTLSHEQLAYGVDRMTKRGLADTVQLTLQDYRKEQGIFDHVVSIEMFEAVGENYWPVYLRKVRESLRKGGTALIQTITVDHALFKGYRKRSDFIRKHIFPGGMLPSPEIFIKMAQEKGLALRESESFGQDYVKTLYAWRERFHEVRKDVLSLGFDNHFIRKWEFYLASCIASFASKRTNVYQFELEAV